MSTDMHSDDTDIARCSSCGGEIPPEGSEAWEESDGDCPGHVAPGSTVCGAFDPSLSWEEKDEGDDAPAGGGFVGARLDSATVDRVWIDGCEATATVSAYEVDADGECDDAICDVRAYVTRCAGEGWVTEDDMRWTPKDGDGREWWAFTLKRAGA